MRTVIGVSCYLEPARWGAWELPAALIPQWYLDLFRAAGATVVLLPPADDAGALDRLDGLAPRAGRDESELALYRRARELGMPVLGICRGLQVMAVAHGGTLTQHLPDLVSETVHRERPGAFVDHGARFAPGTLAGSLLGTDPFVVNSSHHQAVDSAGDLTVSGWAEDGTIEACEDPTADFCLGVQWHPEHPDRLPADLPIVAAFVEAAAGYRASR
jgi:putative glutamine amidotransferase